MPEKFRLQRDSNPIDHSNNGTVLCQLSYQAYRELVTLWVRTIYP